MHVSLIEQNGKEYYLCSAANPREMLIQKKLGLNILTAVFSAGESTQLFYNQLVTKKNNAPVHFLFIDNQLIIQKMCQTQ